MVPPAFVGVFRIVSTLLVVLAVCSMTLVISLLTIVLLALIFPSKLKDNNGASAATGGGSNGMDNMVELPYSTPLLPPTVVAMSPLDRTLAPLAVAGSTATAAGGFGSVVLLAVASSEVALCPLLP